MHKLLTGRKEAFERLREQGGLSGFPKRRESDCDIMPIDWPDVSQTHILKQHSADKQIFQRILGTLQPVEAFERLREQGGLSGFPKRRESDCDAFDTGHSSTSVSAAAGFVPCAKASLQRLILYLMLLPNRL